MFKAAYKSANKEIVVDDALIAQTLDKMSETRRNRISLGKVAKYGGIAAGFAVVITGVMLWSGGTAKIQDEGTPLDVGATLAMPETVAESFATTTAATETYSEEDISTTALTLAMGVPAANDLPIENDGTPNTVVYPVETAVGAYSSYSEIDPSENYGSRFNNEDGLNLLTVPMSDSFANPVYSHLGNFLSTAMISEIAGSTEPLSLSKAYSNEDIRSLADNIYLQNSIYDGAYSNVCFSNSVWIDSEAYESTDPNKSNERVAVLNSSYHANVYIADIQSGDIGDQINSQLQTSINYDALLDYYPDMAAVVVNTMYFESRWEHGFESSEGSAGIFYGKSGEITAEFMTNDSPAEYYECDSFISVGVPLDNGATVYFLLPQDISPEVLLAEHADEIIGSLGEGITANHAVSIPKFDALLVTDEYYYESESDHQLTLIQSYSLSFNENGIGYSIPATESVDGELTKKAMSKDLITFNKPFAYVITANDNVILTGIVTDPTK